MNSSYLLIWGGAIFYGAYIGQKKGRLAFGIIITVTLSVIGLLILIFLPSRNKNQVQTSTLLGPLDQPLNKDSFSSDSIERFVFGLVGGVFGVIVVRVFLLNEIEKIAFSLVMNNLDKISGDDFGTILNSSTFWKCLVGFMLGTAGGEFGHRAYSKNKSIGLCT